MEFWIWSWKSHGILSRQFRGNPEIVLYPETYINSVDIVERTGSILSCASKVGSPTNHLGSKQRQDTGQGSSSPLTGGRNLTPMGEPPTCGHSVKFKRPCLQHWPLTTKN